MVAVNSCSDVEFLKFKLLYNIAPVCFHNHPVSVRHYNFDQMNKF